MLRPSIPVTASALHLGRLARKVGISRAAVYRACINMVAPETHAAVLMVRRHNPFIITSTGRTATRWLAFLLQHVANSHVSHEPVPDEHLLHGRVLIDPDFACQYLLEFRLRDMAQRIRDYRPRIYAEVNPNLRFLAPIIKILVPECRVVHLVRDGRDVVRSVYNRRQDSRRQGHYSQMQPPVIDEYTARWEHLSAFEKVCWGWQYENRLLRTCTSLRARVEDITASYGLFCDQILKPLGLFLPEPVWKKSLSMPVNATKQFSIGPWETWTPEEQRIFRMICGAEMNRYGYSLDAPETALPDGAGVENWSPAAVNLCAHAQHAPYVELA